MSGHHVRYPSLDRSSDGKISCPVRHPRSPQAYPAGLYLDLLAQSGGNGEFHHLACASAQIPDISGDHSRSHEVPQLAQGYLDENTTHVSIGVGGNDIGFSDILKGCIMTTHDCLGSEFRLRRRDLDGANPAADPQSLVEWEPGVIRDIQTPLAEALRQVSILAPNAKITLVGYPHLITRPSSLDQIEPLVSRCPFFEVDEVDWLTFMADLLDDTMLVARNDVNASGRIYFTDPRDRFRQHEACFSDIDSEWINAVVAFSNSGSGYHGPPDGIGDGSFHPKVSGQNALREAVLASFSSPPISSK